MEYRPLKHGEIRVVKILTEGDNPSDTESSIRCTLEHVILDDTSRVVACKAAKSPVRDGRVWPEAYAKADTKSLWNRKHLDSSAFDFDVAISEPTKPKVDVYEDGNLPWRFAWGDYVALSYCWGDAHTTREIIVNGCSRHVIVNLEAALRQLRDSHCIKQGFKLWADAICIDQSNLEERGQQVGRTRDIYFLAWHVFIWLGVDANDSSLAMTAIKHLSARMAMGNPLNGLYRKSRSIDARPLFVIWSTYKSSMR